METIARKLWLVILFFVLLSISFNLFRENREKEKILGIDNRNIEEVVVLEDLDIVDVSNEESNYNTGKEGVYVPYYWKFGINQDLNDYLLGSLPSIKIFNEYYTSRNRVLFGINPERYTYDLKEILKSLIKTTFIYSNGILNSSEYFAWNDGLCENISLDTVDEKIFVCPHWLNWSGIELGRKSYVLTDCNISGRNGYCLFEEYSRLYYDSNKLGEERCFQNDNEKQFCDYEEYVKQIEYN